MKTVKKGCKNKPEKSMENHLMNKKISKKNMEKIDTRISQKKINKN